MRLLGWMHNKLRHTSIDPFKDFTLGNYCACLSAKSSLDDEHFHVRPRFNSIYEDCQKTSFEVDSNTEYENCEDPTSTVMSELFHGFLAIGTLGSKPVHSEPATPTFPSKIEDEKAEVTENDLKLINSQLEKFFEAEAEEEISDESLARSSYVSTITLSGTQLERVSIEDYGKYAVFPLQGYLFGSTIQLPETKPELNKEKTSLGEIFHRTKIIEEVSAETDRKGEMQIKQAHMSAKTLMKKILKKFYASPRNPAPGNGAAANSVSTKQKLNKILRMFHRKVHPEKDFTKCPLETKKTMDHHANLVCEDEHSEEFPPGPNSMEEMQSVENNFKQSHHDLSCINSSGNKEYWIKTDADYLVLEL